MTGDSKPYAFKTTDFGATWTALASPDIKGYAHVVKEDPVNARACSSPERSSACGCRSTAARSGPSSRANLPNVAVRDIAIHPRDHDLILATHGRGIYIVDDITPLRALTSDRRWSATWRSCRRRPSPMVTPVSEFGFNGDAEFVGANPGDGAVITYYLKKRHMLGDLRLEVLRFPGAAADDDSPAASAGASTGSSGRMRRQGSAGGARGGDHPEPGRAHRPARGAAGHVHGEDDQGQATRSRRRVTMVPEPGSRYTDADRAAQRPDRAHALRHGGAAGVPGRRDRRRRGTRRRTRPRGAGERTRCADASPRSPTASSSSGRRSCRRSGARASPGKRNCARKSGMLYGNVNMFEGRPTPSQTRSHGRARRRVDRGVRGVSTRHMSEGRRRR